MKYVRFAHGQTVGFGILREKEIHCLTGDFLLGEKEDGRVLPLDEVRLLSPPIPTKALCTGLNIRDHAEEMMLKLPETPVVFLKPGTAVIAAGEAIRSPALSRQVDFEGELAVVIGKKAKQISETEAGKYIFGYSCANDVTARDLQSRQGQWTVAKGFDTFLPYGPWIETEVEPSALEIRTLLNGKERQRSNTRNLIFSVFYLVSYLSHVMTLLPGDLILTGTPSGVGPMQPGDHVTVEISGIGSLTNPIL